MSLAVHPQLERCRRSCSDADRGELYVVGNVETLISTRTFRTRRALDALRTSRSHFALRTLCSRRALRTSITRRALDTLRACRSYRVIDQSASMNHTVSVCVCVYLQVQVNYLTR